MYTYTDTGADTRSAVSNFDSLLLKTVLLSYAAKTLLTLHISAPIAFMISTVLTASGILQHSKTSQLTVSCSSRRVAISRLGSPGCPAIIANLDIHGFKGESGDDYIKLIHDAVCLHNDGVLRLKSFTFTDRGLPTFKDHAARGLQGECEEAGFTLSLLPGQGNAKV